MERYTVLVVEDDPLLRMNAVMLFEEAGFAVADFDNADAAASFIRDRPAEVGAIFTDINMPGEIHGLELATMVSTQWPRITVLVTSGRYAKRPDSLPPHVKFIAKPWLPSELLVTMQGSADPDTGR